MLFLFYVYIACLVVGGVLVGASLLLGHDGGDAEHELEAGGDADAEHDLDQDADHEVSHEADHDAAHEADHDVGQAADHGHDGVSVALQAAGAAGALWLPFFSTRFWTFFLAFFGLTGVVLSGLHLAGAILTLTLAVLVGLGTGTTAAYAIRRLRSHAVGVVEGMQDFIGRDGVVLLPVSRERPGQIRIQAAGRDVDLLAFTDEVEPIAAHEKVLLIESREDGVAVCRLPEVDEAAGGSAATAAAPTGSTVAAAMATRTTATTTK